MNWKILIFTIIAVYGISGTFMGCLTILVYNLSLAYLIIPSILSIIGVIGIIGLTNEIKDT